MFKSLYGRLAAVLVGLLVVVAGLHLLVTVNALRLYLEEANQDLNHSLAEHLVADTRLSVRDGRFDEAALQSIFHTYMVVNPSIEVYLLDRDGRILAFSAPPGQVRRQRVDLAPVRAFLAHGGRLPILGDDPRAPGQAKVFSAAPVGPAADPGGYLYVVLAGQRYTSVARLLEGSLILRLAAWGLAGSLVAGLIIGLLLFHLLTRRLRRLDGAMAAFERDGMADEAYPLPIVDTRSDDELGRLGRRFTDMAGRIGAQLRALRETDALRRELVANVSHDLRTPITSLQGYLETLLLKESTLNAADRRRYIETAIRHSERLGKLVAELFELATLDSGRMGPHPEPFALGELVQDVAMKFQLQAERGGVALATDIPPDLPFVAADIGLIERVLENLLDNALRHTPAGGRVAVSLVREAGRVRVQVADTGIGIPAEALPHVFDRFYQVQRSGRVEGGGAGLGLAITKRILDLHASPIGVDSVPGAGTRFAFALPAAA